LFIGNLARFMDSSDRLCSFPIISLCKAHFKGVKLPLGQVAPDVPPGSQISVRQVRLARCMVFVVLCTRVRDVAKVVFEYHHHIYPTLHRRTRSTT
jgi:hypothetical protein